MKRTELARKTPLKAKRAGKPRRGACALCGHSPPCGNASADGQPLCHAEPSAECSPQGRSCYVRWTVYGERPKKPKPRRVAATCTIRGCRRKPVAEGMCATHCKQEADRLFSLIIRTPGACVECGSVSALQCAHIVSRRYLATRWDFDAAVCLCAKCHTRWTHDPLGWEAWCDDRLGYHHTIIKAKARAGGRPDYPSILERLRTWHGNGGVSANAGGPNAPAMQSSGGCAESTSRPRSGEANSRPRQEADVTSQPPGTSA